MTASVFLVALTGAFILALDIVWLRFATQSVYAPEIGALLRAKPNIPAAAAFYVLYLLGVVIFVVQPAFEQGSAMRALTYGALFGLVAYGTFNLTNRAVMRGYTTRIAIIDMAAGSLITATTSCLAVWIALRSTG